MGFFSTPKTDTQMSVISDSERQQESLPSPAKISSTVITQGVTVKGTIRGEGVVQVEGVVEGEFSMVGAVIVSDTGLVRGPVSADVVRVAGRVEGNVVAREHMRLEQTGTLIGDVATASLVVEDGGCLNGRSTMTKAPEPDPELRTVQDLGDLQFGPGYDVDSE
ncbi:MAG: polymer-forming cytoskeletal protein [Oscillospiraceae bacterium]|jgi:cytoskeletal protein CcmA (bactofilin family)|nr:polymer-forming cytoskeletal protein [Oscillospiraceae bacterium]